MTEAQRAALDKWADINGERAAIEEFVVWAERSGGISVEATVGGLRAMLDQFCGINRRDLDDARRALLQEIEAPR